MAALLRLLPQHGFHGEFPHRAEHEQCECRGVYEEEYCKFDGELKLFSRLQGIASFKQQRQYPITDPSVFQLFIAYCVGNIIGPQLFLANEAPVYQTGFLSIMTCYAIGICACFALRIYLVALNKRRDRETGVPQVEGEGGSTGPFEDRTDKEEGSFRYVY